MNIHNEYGNPIDEKIQLLRDFRILGDDAIEEENDVRRILDTCDNEIQMGQKLYRVIHGTETLNEFIDRHQI